MTSVFVYLPSYCHHLLPFGKCRCTLIFSRILRLDVIGFLMNSICYGLKRLFDGNASNFKIGVRNLATSIFMILVWKKMGIFAV